MFDALDPAMHVVEPQLGGGLINLHRRQIALDRAEPEHDLGGTRLDPIKSVMDSCEIGAEEAEDLGFVSPWGVCAKNWGE